MKQETKEEEEIRRTEENEDEYILKKRSQANRIHLCKENTLNVFCQDEFRLQRDLLLCHFGEELVFEYIKS